MHSEPWENGYQLRTAVFRRIGQYSGLNFNEVLDLPYPAFLLLNRDSWIDSWTRSEDGVEFLKTLWRLQQTKADETAIHRFEHRKDGD